MRESLQPAPPKLDLVDTRERLAKVEVLALEDDLALRARGGRVDLEDGDEPRERQRGLQSRRSASLRGAEQVRDCDAPWRSVWSAYHPSCPARTAAAPPSLHRARSPRPPPPPPPRPPLSASRTRPARGTPSQGRGRALAAARPLARTRPARASLTEEAGPSRYCSPTTWACRAQWSGGLPSSPMRSTTRYGARRRRPLSAATLRGRECRVPSSRGKPGQRTTRRGRRRGRSCRRGRPIRRRQSAPAASRTRAQAPSRARTPRSSPCNGRPVGRVPVSCGPEESRGEADALEPRCGRSLPRPTCPTR